jgi:hypothetical protein
MMTPRFRSFMPAALILGFSLFIARASGQDIAVPVELQLPLFKKVLTFDRNLDKRSDGDLVVCVLFQSSFGRSLAVKNDFFDCLGKSPVQTLGRFALRYEAIDMSETPDWLAEASAMRVNILYIAPLRAVDVKTIFRKSQSHRWVTWTGVMEYVDAGCSIGIVLKGDRPSIRINLPASKSEGLDFSSQLLNFVQVISDTKG